MKSGHAADIIEGPPLLRVVGCLPMTDDAARLRRQASDKPSQGRCYGAAARILHPSTLM
jgi:hypothetical protein